MSDEGRGDCPMTGITSSSSEQQQLPNLMGRLLKKFVIVKKIDEGSFGAIYLARKNSEKGKIKVDEKIDHNNIPENELPEYRVVKAESNYTQGGCGLKIEVQILHKINKIFPKSEQFVKIDTANKRKNYSYIFMPLLGESLKNLVARQPEGRFSDSTWLRISIQALYAVKQLHEIGYIHRDLKPANFVMGHKNDARRCRFVHLIDFGLARQFMYKDKEGNLIYRKPRKNVDFRGTELYCSLSMHYDREQKRIDDIWALLFTLMEMHKSLPWSCVEVNKVEEKKKSTKLVEIINLLPVELGKPFENLNKIEPKHRPNYEEIYSGFRDCMLKNKYSFNDPYDWEVTVNPKAPNMKYYSCMSEQFKSDLLAGLKYPKEEDSSSTPTNNGSQKETGETVDTDLSVCHIY
uniref:non-specific serine/threonine protein kinase n=1 Tax=Parastrongyloides trichosuri TaxID=131310 RepID=A0A0N4Z1W3_PARTI